LKNAVIKKNPIAIFEMSERNLFSILALFPSFFMVFMSIPFIKPFKWSRIIYTYILPVIPITLLYDGIISCVNTYPLNELEKIIKIADPDSRYVWKTGRKKMKGPPLYVTYLTGYPDDKNQENTDKCS